jgi:patatin-like phospholipase/acyl hydrolase
MSGNKKIKILSIDGGGVRGIIPLVILSHIESLLPKGKPLAKYFDIISGTSIGGIIALMLAHPKEYSAQTILDLFPDIAKSIFKQSFFKKLDSTGIFGPKYDATNLENELDEYLGEATLNDGLTKLCIPAFSMKTNSIVCFEDNFNMKTLLMKDVGRATSAAPTYFSPFYFNWDIYIDGGISVNDPAEEALKYAKQIFTISDNCYSPFVLSIGTGIQKLNYNIYDAGNWGGIEWAEHILNMMMTSEVSTVNDILSGILKSDEYIRMQCFIDPKNGCIDDVSADNFKSLICYGKEIIEHYSEYKFQEIVKVLTEC